MFMHGESGDAEIILMLYKPDRYRYRYTADFNNYVHAARGRRWCCRFKCLSSVCD